MSHAKEEYAYALERALSSRGSAFPVIALFPSSIDNALIPAGIRTRLYVTLTDPDWKERVVAAAEGRALGVVKAHVEPFQINVYTGAGPRGEFVIEVRPRAGTWAPFIAAVPAAEKDTLNLSLLRGSRGIPPRGGYLFITNQGVTTDNKWHFIISSDEATPTTSFYMLCRDKPSKILFGVGTPTGLQYIVPL